MNLQTLVFQIITIGKISPKVPNSFKNWALEASNVLSAWEYSIGTGVTAAFIDYGYNIHHSETTGRLILGANNYQSFGGAWINRNDPSFLNKTSTLVEIGKDTGFLKNPGTQQTHHGHYALMTGFAQRENLVGTAPNKRANTIHSVGVAPNAKVIPYHATFSYEYAAAISEARKQGSRLIGLNMAWKYYSFSTFYQAIQETIIGAMTGGNFINQQIEDALKEGRVVVVAAHNHHESIEQWTPTRLMDEWDDIGLSLIVVGSVQPYDNTVAEPVQIIPTPLPSVSPAPGMSPTPVPSSSPLRTPLFLSANHNPDMVNETDIVKSNGKGSNYGQGMIWAPGKYNLVSDLTENTISYYNGTSAATPFVTGVVALMLSRNPNLTPHEVREKLRAARGPVIKPNPGMVSHGISPAYLLDAEKAVKSVASVPKAETYFATLFESGSQKTAIFNKSAQLSANNNGGLEQSKQLMDSVSREV